MRLMTSVRRGTKLVRSRVTRRSGSAGPSCSVVVIETNVQHRGEGRAEPA
jgi:hypothetical protein